MLRPALSSARVPSGLIRRALVSLVAFPAAVALAAPASAAETTHTQAYSFADGLGAGQQVAKAEDGVPLRSVSNLKILAAEFRSNYGGTPLPVTVTGIADGDRNGIDDDGKVDVALFGARSCLRLGLNAYTVSNGTCAAGVASGDAVRASAVGVAGAARWYVSSENAWAAEGYGARMHYWSITGIKSGFTELRTSVTVRGLGDADKNGVDDDGRFRVTNGTSSLCVQLSKTGGTATIGSC